MRSACRTRIYRDEEAGEDDDGARRDRASETSAKRLTEAILQTDDDGERGRRREEELGVAPNSSGFGPFREVDESDVADAEHELAGTCGRT
jgi:hypothetical protein